MADVGYRMRDTRYGMQDAGYGMQEGRESLLIPYPESKIQNPASRISYLYKQNGKYFLDAPYGYITSPSRVFNDSERCVSSIRPYRTY